MIAQLASVLRDQSRIIEDAMEHLQHLPAQFRRLFKQHAAQTQRMTPDQGAHPGRAAANDDYIVIRHLNLTAETERRREWGTRIQGDKVTDRWFFLSPCLLVSLSPSPSPCLHNSAIKSTIACGKGASRFISLPVAGWRKSRRAACSRWYFNLCFVVIGSTVEA